jgi:integral membrane protein (TIGR03766 family)
MLNISPTLVYVCKKTFLFSNITLLKIDILALLILFIIWNVVRKHLVNFIDKNGTRIILICSVVLFFTQIYVSYNIYFLTGWDAGGAVIPAARAIAFGMPVNNFNYYFSLYPNNISLVWIFSSVLKLSSKLGLSNWGNGLMLLITINCFISSLSSFLTYKCVEKLIDKRWAVFSWIMYFLLVGTSPWVVITYSDPFALFLPILIFFIYSRDVSNKYNFIKWFLIGILSFLGYGIKPQVIILLISIGIIEIWRFLFLSNAEKMKKCIMLAALILSFVLSNNLYKVMCKQTGFNIDKKMALGASHFAMMGMNEKCGGYYSFEDVRYSNSFTEPAERSKANIKVIKERLKNFGAQGYKKFLMKKTLVNYGDGTFAWSMEGGFYNELYADKNKWSSPVLKSFYYSDGSNYKKTSTLQQAVWIAAVASMLGLIFIKKQQMDRNTAVLMLTILGLTVFQLLFEARARYLYSYSPIYICLSILGLKNIVFIVNKFIQHSKVK